MIFCPLRRGRHLDIRILHGQPSVEVGFYVADDSAVESGSLARAGLQYGLAVMAGFGTVLPKNLDVVGFGMAFLVLVGAAAAAPFRRNAAIGNVDAGLFLVSTGSSPPR